MRKPAASIAAAPCWPATTICSPGSSIRTFARRTNLRRRSIVGATSSRGRMPRMPDGVRQQVQDRQHAPLGSRVCRQQRPPGCEAAGVVGDLPLQERHGVGAGEAQHAQMEQAPGVLSHAGIKSTVSPGCQPRRSRPPAQERGYWSRFSGKICGVIANDDDQPRESGRSCRSEARTRGERRARTRRPQRP